MRAPSDADTMPGIAGGPHKVLRSRAPPAAARFGLLGAMPAIVLGHAVRELTVSENAHHDSIRLTVTSFGRPAIFAATTAVSATPTHRSDPRHHPRPVQPKISRWRREKFAVDAILATTAGCLSVRFFEPPKLQADR